jgi:hypothetical protein
MKQRLSRNELEPKLLAAIQAEPDCAEVQEVGVTAVNVVGDLPTWHVNIISEGSVPIEVARHAASRVQDRFLALYVLDA